MAFTNLDNEQGTLLAYLNSLQTPISAVVVTTDLTGVGTGTDMTAAQAGQIQADLTALAAAVNSLRDSLAP